MRKTNVRKRVENLFRSDEPCAVMEYYEWFKMDKMIENKKFEVITINLEHNYLDYIELRDKEVKLFRENMGRFKLAADTESGKVWDKGDFKKIYDENKPKQ